MSERATDFIVLRIPVVRELDLGALIARSGEKHQGEASLLVRMAPHLFQSKRIAIKTQCAVEIGDANHGVEIFHKKALGTRLWVLGAGSRISDSEILTLASAQRPVPAISC